MGINLKSKTVLAAGVAASVLAGGGAYAFWTGGGQGTGSGATAAGTVALTVNQAALSAMTPGAAAQTLTGTFGNTNTAPVYVTSVTASITGVTPVGAAVCGVENFALSSAAMTVAASVAVGNPMGSWTGATLRMLDTGVNQDGCKGATVNLAYAVA